MNRISTVQMLQGYLSEFDSSFNYDISRRSHSFEKKLTVKLVMRWCTGALIRREQMSDSSRAADDRLSRQVDDDIYSKVALNGPGARSPCGCFVVSAALYVGAH